MLIAAAVDFQWDFRLTPYRLVVGPWSQNGKITKSRGLLDGTGLTGSRNSRPRGYASSGYRMLIAAAVDFQWDFRLTPYRLVVWPCPKIGPFWRPLLNPFLFFANFYMCISGKGSKSTSRKYIHIYIHTLS